MCAAIRAAEEEGGSPASREAAEEGGKPGSPGCWSGEPGKPGGSPGIPPGTPPAACSCIRRDRSGRCCCCKGLGERGAACASFFISLFVGGQLFSEGLSMSLLCLSMFYGQEVSD